MLGNGGEVASAFAVEAGGVWVLKAPVADWCRGYSIMKTEPDVEEHYPADIT